MEINVIDERIDIAVSIVKEAGADCLEYYYGNKYFENRKKDRGELVTSADKEVERFIKNSVAKKYPNDSFFGEESGGNTGEICWVVDPIDGTGNFAKKIPYWCISMALVCNKRVCGAVIYDALHDELFSSVSGRGSYVNGKRMCVTDCSEVSEARVGFGFAHKSDLQETMKTVGALWGSGATLRLLGAGALTLAHLADGRIDAYFEHYINSWDCLAGILLIEEAGGMASKFPLDNLGEPNKILASNKKLYSSLSSMLKISQVA